LIKNKKEIFILILLFCVCIGIYGARLHGNFIVDDHTLVEETRLHNLKYIPTFFEKPIFGHYRYRPLGQAVRTVLYYFFHDSMHLHRIYNLFLFALYCLVMFVFLKKLFKDDFLAGMASLLFCIHPMNTFFIYYYTSSDVVFSGLCVLISSICFLSFYDHKEYLLYVLSLVLYLGAVLSYELNLIFPAYLFLIILFKSKGATDFKRRIVWILPFFFMSMLYILFRIYSKTLSSEFVRDLSGSGIIGYIAALFRLIAWYLSKLIYPSNIIVLWNIPAIRGNIILDSILFLILLVSAGYLIAVNWKKNLSSFALAWLFLGFVPLTVTTFCIPDLGTVIQTQWFLFSSLGFFVLLTMGLYKLKLLIRRPLWILLICLLVVFMSKKTNEQIKIWKSEKTLCEYWLKVRPGNPIPTMRLAVKYLQDKDIVMAKRYFYKMLDTSDYERHKVYNNLGLICLMEKSHDRAKDYFEESVALRPDYAIAHNNLGTVFVQMKRMPEAIKACTTALEYNSFLLEPRLNLGKIYKDQKDPKQAILWLEENLKIDPFDKQTLQLLVDVYLECNQNDKALVAGKSILKKVADDSVLTSVASSFAQKGYNQMAVTLLTKAIRNNPRYQNAYLELGKIYGNLNKFDEAIEIWRAGQSVDPGDKRFKEMILQAMKLKGKLYGDPK